MLVFQGYSRLFTAFRNLFTLNVSRNYCLILLCSKWRPRASTHWFTISLTDNCTLSNVSGYDESMNLSWNELYVCLSKEKYVISFKKKKKKQMSSWNLKSTRPPRPRFLKYLPRNKETLICSISNSLGHNYSVYIPSPYIETKRFLLQTQRTSCKFSQVNRVSRDNFTMASWSKFPTASGSVSSSEDLAATPFKRNQTSVTTRRARVSSRPVCSRPSEFSI